MITKLAVPLLGLLLLANAPRWRTPVEPLAPDRALATLFPDSTVLFVEGPGVAELLRGGADDPFVARVLASPLGEALGGEAGLAELVGRASPWLGEEPLATLASLAANGVALGVVPRGPKPGVALALLGDDAERTAEIVQGVLDRAAEEAGFPRAFERPTDRALGADVWHVGEELVVARRDALLVAGNEGAFVRDMLALAADADGRGLGASEAFRAARAERPADALLWAFLDAERVRALPFGGGKRLSKLAELAAVPQVQLLLGPNVAELGSARVAAASLELDAGGLALTLHGTGTASQDLVRPRAGEPGPPLPARTERDVATAVLHRDLDAVLRHRAELFPPEVLPSLAKPLSELSVLFGGADLSEELLPRVGPWMVLVARDVPFDEGAVPEIRLPALAGLFRLEEPEDVGPRLEAAFQTLVAISNVERAQRGEAPLLLSLVHEGDVSVSRAAFLAPPEGEGVDARYNLEPACARVGDVLVLGTHEVLVRELVRQLATDDVVGRAGGSERLTLDAAALARAVAENREALVTRAVLEEGKSYAEAEADLDGLRAILDLLSAGRVALDGSGGTVALRVELALDGGPEERLR